MFELDCMLSAQTLVTDTTVERQYQISTQSQNTSRKVGANGRAPGIAAAAKKTTASHTRIQFIWTILVFITNR
jgi:hypothetical protein